MPGIVSAKTLSLCWLGYAALGAYARDGSAISNEAQEAQKAATAVADSAERSQALFGAKADSISNLLALANDCAQPDWDGNGASAIHPLAVRIAEDFVRALPDAIPLPEFAPEPDGSISLDWIQSRNRLFSLSVGASNRLAYAWLDGSDKGHGVAGFDGERIPRKIIEGICGIMDHGNVTLRAA
jgi:hypothetical protein